MSEGADDVDVLIIGAGISGIGGAAHLRMRCPDTSFAILEAKESFGGTWLTHRFPGIRSDSDLYTYGYGFKPWMGPAIATADEIRAYMAEVIAEYRLEPQTRYRHKVTAASWSSETARWTVEATRLDDGAAVRFRARLLWMCQGYYRHEKGFAPHFEGQESFKGPVVHPQTWPEGLDCSGKRVTVIGSGATAATLIPALAEAGAKVTMLQRSPSYYITELGAAALAKVLEPLDLDPAVKHDILRRKSLYDSALFTSRTFSEPEQVKKELLGLVRAYLGPDYDVDHHFTPHYRPWQQRICRIPDGDLFNAIRGGRVTVVTDEIDRFTEAGIRLKSGQEIASDVIVTATGLNLTILGDMKVTVDGQPFDPAQKITYRGMMFEGVPNLVWVFGYFRASWTLRADLVAQFVCRLIPHMRERQAAHVTPRLRPEDEGLPTLPWIDAENFNPSYLGRDLGLLPKRLARPEWEHTHDYAIEKVRFPGIDLDEAALTYG
ncbi:MAG: NAD(P)/FAD-dependent oxidoreductase [Geminicoccaceae bacterium]